MIYNDLQEIGTRIGSYALTIYSLDKLGLEKYINSNDSREMLAVKTAALLAGSEYVSDMALEKLGIRVPTPFASDMECFVKHFISNAAVYYIIDKTDFDQVFFRMAGNSTERRALALAVIFTIVNEISNKIITYWSL